MKELFYMLLIGIIVSIFYVSSSLAIVEDNNRIIEVRGDYKYPPFEFINQEGEADGFNIEIIKAVARSMNMPLRIELGPWDVVRKQLENREIDALSGMYKTETRDKRVDFSVPHFITSYSVFVRKDSTINDLKACYDKEIIVQKGDLGHDYVVENDISNKVILEENLEAALLSLSAGKGDCAILSRLQGVTIGKKMGVKNTMPVGKPVAQRKYCIAVSEGDSNLLAKFNEGLVIIKTSGEFDRIHDKWFSAHKSETISLHQILKKTVWILLPLLILVISGFLLSLILNNKVKKKTAILFDELKERRLIEEKLRNSEERYRLIAENVADVIWTLNINFHLTFISPSVFQQIGYSVTEVMKHPVVEIFLPESLEYIKNLYAEKLALVNSGNPAGWEPFTYEARQYCKNGDVILTHNNVRILPSPENRPANILGVTRDITDIKRAEKAVLKAERHAAEQTKHALVGQIAGKIAHDFNNILGVILGNTEISLMDCKDEATKQTLELIFKQTIRGRNLTRDLMAFAKDQEPKQEFIDVNDKVELVLNLLKKDMAGIDITRAFSYDIPELLADPGMIEHALVNLVQNAIHALSRNDNKEVSIRTGTEESSIFIEIEDNGCGIPDEFLDNIYDPSFTLKGSRDLSKAYAGDVKGTGYGMANVKKYIEQHRGSISVTSELNTGTVFTVSLPVTKKELTNEEIKEFVKSGIQSGKRVLIIEDEPAISDVQFKILSLPPCNHLVDVAGSGLVAMELYGKNEYDIISLDYVLPGQINGMDIYRHIRKTNTKIPVLFISGNIEFLESIKSLKEQDRNIDHISKPCQNKEYVECFNGLLL